MSLKLLHVCSMAPLGEMQREEPPSPFETSFLVLLSGNPRFPQGPWKGVQAAGEKGRSWVGGSQFLLLVTNSSGLFGLQPWPWFGVCTPGTRGWRLIQAGFPLLPPSAVLQNHGEGCEGSFEQPRAAGVTVGYPSSGITGPGSRSVQ